MSRISIHETSLTLPQGFRTEDSSDILAIGDIHGMADHLAAILDYADGRAPSACNRIVVFMGDLIDRGPQSLRALDLALSAHQRPNVSQVIGLAGNHENMLRLSIARDKSRLVTSSAFEIWRANGGETVLQEIMEITGSAQDAESLEAFLEGPRAAWLAALQSHYFSGNLLFVHAGIHPDTPPHQYLGQPWDVPLHNLDEDYHWAWIREPFLEAVPTHGHHGYFVVHGHSPVGVGDVATTQQQIGRFRLNLDGGSFATGITRAAIIVGQHITLLDCWQSEKA